VPFEISGILSAIAITLVILFVPNVYKKSEKVKVYLSKLFNRNSIILLISMFVFGIAVFAGYDTYYSSFLIHYIHLSTVVAGVVYAMGGVGGILLSIPIGMVGDRTNRRYGMLLSGFLFALGSVGMFYLAKTAFEQGIFVFIFGAGFGTFENIAVAFGQDYTQDASAGMIGGAVMGIYNVGAIVGGPLFGYVLSVSNYLEAGVLTVIIPAILMVIIISFTRRPVYNKEMPLKPEFSKR
jgi:Arabinose efflux permease